MNLHPHGGGGGGPRTRRSAGIHFNYATAIQMRNHLIGIENSIEIVLRATNSRMLSFQKLNEALHRTTALGTALRVILPQAAQVFYLLERKQSRQQFPDVHIMMHDFVRNMEEYLLGAASNLHPIWGEPPGGFLPPQEHANACHYVECIYTTLIRINTDASHGSIPH